MPAGNWIGPFQVIRLEGWLEMPQRNFDIETRAGVNGQAVYQTGRRSDAIRLLSVVDVLNQAFAELLYESYVARVGEIHQIWQMSVTPWNTKYMILHVHKMRIQNHIFAIGGLNNGATTLACMWDVLPVEEVAT